MTQSKITETENTKRKEKLIKILINTKIVLKYHYFIDIWHVIS